MKQTLITGNVEAELQDMEKARQIGDALTSHYPGHIWIVYPHGDCFVVKNIAISEKYSYIIKGSECYSASNTVKMAVKAGGELLERAAMKRGQWDGRMAESLEGSDPRHFQGWLNQAINIVSDRRL